MSLAQTRQKAWTSGRLWLERLSDAFLSVDPIIARNLALAVLAIQLAGCLAATVSHVMLQGDGSFFVYALAADAPWHIKWQAIPARAAIYVLTVLPTLSLSRWLTLSPMQIAALNGFIFYAIPAVQFAIVIALGWKRFPRLLVFPAAQYALASVFGYGFSSEILLAPGFLWICLFLIARGEETSPWLWLSLLGLTFCHELAVPSALATGAWAVWQAAQKDKAGGGLRRLIAIAGVVAVFGAFIAVRAMGGGKGSDSNIIYVFDPRRFFDNATLWATLLFWAGCGLAVWRRRQTLSPLVLGAVVVLAMVLPLLADLAAPTVFNFAIGRYETGRTLIGGMMFALTLLFIFARGLPQPAASSASDATAPNGSAYLVTALALALAVNVGAAGAMLWEWNTALAGDRQVIADAGVGAKMVRLDQAQSLMTPGQSLANHKLGFDWTLPYRSAVLADGAMPGAMIYGDTGYGAVCPTEAYVQPDRSLFPAAVHADMRWLCTYTPLPMPYGLGHKIKAAVFNLISRHP